MTPRATNGTSAPSTTKDQISGTVRTHASAKGTGRSPAAPGVDTILQESVSWEYVKRLRLPQPTTLGAGAWRKLIRRDRRKALQLSVRYRGGSEAWWELSGRGVTVRCPGWMSLHDVLDRFTGTI